MIKPNRPSEENRANSSLKVSKPEPGETSKVRFDSADDFSNWIEDQLDHLEALKGTLALLASELYFEAFVS